MLQIGPGNHLVAHEDLLVAAYAGRANPQMLRRMLLTEEDRKFMSTEQIVASQMLSNQLCESSNKYMDKWAEKYLDKEADKAVTAVKKALLEKKKKQTMKIAKKKKKQALETARKEKKEGDKEKDKQDDDMKAAEPNVAEDVSVAPLSGDKGE